MKIIHIINGLNAGGAQRVLYNLLEEGLNEKFDNHVISLIDNGTMEQEFDALGVTVTTLGMRAGRPSLSSMIKLNKVILRLQPDLIQGWMYHGNIVATMARFFATGRPALVWSIHHSLYDLNHEKLMTRQVIRANRFYSFSPDVIHYCGHLSQNLHEKFGFVSEKGLVIPNGIDLQKFCFSADVRQQVRTELAIPADALVVGHVARLHPMKDHANFLRAAELIALKHPNVHFLLCGIGVSLDDSYFKQKIAITLQNRFHLLGERTDVVDLMCAMDVFCQSSWTEAFPNVLGEAMAVGVPCVATNVGDSGLIIGDYGVVVAPRNSEVLAAGIESLLSLPSDERQLLGKQARRHIEEKFSLPAIVEQYVDLYKNLEHS